MQSRLLTCGIVAGPVFVAVVLTQAAVRPGYDLSSHPISLLSLGDAGWVQIANFVLAGGLVLAAAVGLRRALHPGPAAAWGPWLVAVFGLGLIAGGVFVTDAGAGFPPGAPSGAPVMSWHGAIHAIAFPVASLAMTVGCLVFLRRFVVLRRWGLAAAVVAGVVVTVLLLSWPDVQGFSLRLLVVTATQFALVAVFAAHAAGAGPAPDRRDADPADTDADIAVGSSVPADSVVQRPA